MGGERVSGIERASGSGDRERETEKWARLADSVSGARSDDGRGTKPVWFPLRGIFCTVWLVQGCGMPGFVVQGPKSDDRDSLGSKNRLIPLIYLQSFHYFRKPL